VTAVIEATDRLLAGPALAAGPESLAAHNVRLGPLPARDPELISVLEASGLLGRGGAGFPVGRKWRSVAERRTGKAVVVANGAEGEPLSSKDRTLMAARPHLVLDGGLLAASAVGADELIVYVGGDHGAAVVAMKRAIAERRTAGSGRANLPIRLIEAPVAYISGESSAVVNFINVGDARPTTNPPHPRDRGVAGRATLVQNVESLGHAALIARHGVDWYRSAGRGPTSGTALVTVSGAVARPGVREIDYGTTLGEVIGEAGGATSDIQAVLLGGYFGGWASVDDLRNAPLDPALLADRGLSFGCGLVAFLPVDICGVRATSRILDYMAGESARQCGPCIFGLGAIAETTRRVAGGGALPGDLDNLARWATQIAGRGACHHPDGAAGLLSGALSVFAAEFDLHQRDRWCSEGASAVDGVR
jgi:NADH:ubiquinone oxidoreductase subunit F (NADH-binding)